MGSEANLGGDLSNLTSDNILMGGFWEDVCTLGRLPCGSQVENQLL